MALDTVTVGANQREIQVIGDPNTSANQLSVSQKHSGDAQAIDSSIFSLVIARVGMLLNAGGTFDRQRAAVGTTGILAVDTESTKATYSYTATAFGLVATATDFVGIIGSGTKTVRVKRIAISGIANAAAAVDILLIKRSTANSGSTPVALTAVPHDSNNAAATATVNSYTTTNPTTGNAVGTLRSSKLNLGTSGAGGTQQLVWDFGTRNDQAVVLRGAAQMLCLNFNGAAVPAGTALDIEIETTEE